MLQTVNKPPPEISSTKEVRVFVKLRNELIRIPFFLKYYRDLGADRFIIVDNASTDGSSPLLASEPDVHLFITQASFRQASGGQAWLDTLLDRYGAGHWCLTVDADELLYYPDVETTQLPALCRRIMAEGAEALPCMLLDMYGTATASVAAYYPGQPFTAACEWFDGGPYRRTGPAPDCPYHEIYGGVRQRVFFPHWQAPSFGLRFTERLYNVGNRFSVIRRNARVQGWRTERPPNLAKVPLVLWRKGMRYLATTHKITSVRLSEGTGALLHFKFLGDFGAKAELEAQRREYFDGAREYRRYAAILGKDPKLSLWHSESIRLTGSRQLCELGLMTTFPDAAAPGRRVPEMQAHV